MSLFFDDDNRIPVSFSVKPPTIDTYDDAVFLSAELWNCLSTPQSDRICLLIAHQSSSCALLFQPMLAWAVPDESTTGLAIPQHLVEANSLLFPNSVSLPKSVTVTVVRPVPLTDVFVTALSNEAYATACRPESILWSWMSTRSPILRQGVTYSLSSPMLATNGYQGSPQLFRYRIDMTTPVLQGYFHAGSTRLVVTADHTFPAAGGEKAEIDGIEICEDFLASTVMRSRPVVYPRSQAIPPEPNVAASIEASLAPASPSEMYFESQPLLQPLTPKDNMTLYLRMADLSRLGLLDGDWAIAGTCDSSRQRLVCVAANDDLVYESGLVLGSPVLLYNISLGTSSSSKILLSPSTFNSDPPPLPMAQTLTLARIASPFSNDRTYEPMVLHALKAHFSNGHQIVAKGDQICTAIDTNALRRCTDTSVNTDEVSDGPEQLHYSYPASPSCTNEIVYFVVTHVAGNGLPDDKIVQGTNDRLGYWVSPELTQIIQTGLKHSLVPDVACFFLKDGMFPRSLSSVRPAYPSILQPDSPFQSLVQLLAATLVPSAVDYNLQAFILLKGARGSGKLALLGWVAQCLGIHLLELNCYDLLHENNIKTQGTLEVHFEKASSSSPSMLVLRHIETLTQATQTGGGGDQAITTSTLLQECICNIQTTWKATGHPVIIVGTTSQLDQVPVSLRSCFKHEIDIKAPSELERHDMLESLLRGYMLAPDISVSTLATQTAALVASDIANLVMYSELLCLQHGTSLIHMDTNVFYAGVLLTAATSTLALGKIRVAYSESIGVPKIPNVSWDDVGGLAHVKSNILDTIQLPLEHPELFADGLKKRSGILLYGPPGTGKTLLAKAVATSFSLNFFSIKGPELLNMYIGESEANVRNIFQRARDATPCVIFFDELDSVAPKRGNHGDSGGVMDRIVSQLLAELDGMTSGITADVFIIGATNRPDLLDPALLRPGRFDQMLYLGVASTHEAQQHILHALTRKFQLDPMFNLSALAVQCPFNYTGADFYALCSDAMLNAMLRKVKIVEERIAYMHASNASSASPAITAQYYLAELASPDDLEILVTQQDFQMSLEGLVPSVSQSEMKHYNRIQNHFSSKNLED